MIEDLLHRFDEVLAFRDTLDAETDRGCALMSAAYLDSQLEELIRANLVDDNKTADELLAQSKPLASFSSRIDLAYLLGCIGKMVHRDLHLIRKIRNDFGHTSTPLDFTHAPIAARCREMYHCFRKDDAHPRKRFTNTVLSVLACVHGQNQLSKRPTVKTDIPITPESREALRKSTDTILAIIEQLKPNEPTT